MDKKAAEERFMKSLKQWDELSHRQRPERVLDSGTDVDGAVEQMFAQLLGRQSIPPA